MQEPSVRKVRWALVIAKLRSKVGLALLVTGLGVAVWQFSVGHVLAGSVVVALLAFNYSCVGAATGLWLSVRGGSRAA